jgi:hypothetical protein
MTLTTREFVMRWKPDHSKPKPSADEQAERELAAARRQVARLEAENAALLGVLRTCCAVVHPYYQPSRVAGTRPLQKAITIQSPATRK